jgi:hypothetical protein
MKATELEWMNAVWLSVVSACVGEIDASMQAIWIEFVGGLDIVIHIQVDEVTPQLLENAGDIADEVVPLMNPEELGYVTTALQVDPPDIAPEDATRFRWIYLAKN